MSAIERRIVLRTDDDSVIELTWTERNRKIMIEFEERSAPDEPTVTPAAAAEPVPALEQYGRSDAEVSR